jgi:hypothetical protein
MTEVMSRIHGGVPPTEQQIDAALARIAPRGPGARPYERDDPPPAMEAAVERMQAAVLPTEPPRPMSGVIQPSPGHRLAANATDYLIIFSLAACGLFWSPTILGAGLQMYLTRVSPIISHLLTNSDHPTKPDEQ